MQKGWEEGEKNVKGKRVTRQNSRHFVTPPVVSGRNDVWETSAEILHWWRVTYPDVGSPFDRPCVCRVGNLLQPIKSTTQIWVVTRPQCGISALVCQTSFRGETGALLASQNVGCFLRLGKGKGVYFLLFQYPLPFSLDAWHAGFLSSESFPTQHNICIKILFPP